MTKFAGLAGDIIDDSTNPSTRFPVAQFAPTNPATTVSGAGVMMGLGAQATPVVFTPQSSGKVEITISGDLDNNTINDGVSLQIRHGTGAAPANGAALTGTADGSAPVQVNPNVASVLDRVPFSTQAIVTGLVLGTQIWVDLGVAAVTGGTARVRNLDVSIRELP